MGLSKMRKVAFWLHAVKLMQVKSHPRISFNRFMGKG